jgi:hypothetical protein
MIPSAEYFDRDGFHWRARGHAGGGEGGGQDSMEIHLKLYARDSYACCGSIYSLGRQVSFCCGLFLHAFSRDRHM